MTPLDFLRTYDPDRRQILGDCASASPLQIEDGERVGVVLFNLGGPESLEDVEPFLYHLLMDPLFLDLPVGGRLRHWVAKSVAHFRAKSLRDHYELIGGGSPLTRLAGEQAEDLQRHLNEGYGESLGVEFRTYPAMRYGHPFAEEAAAQMAEDDLDKVVLVPSYPQYSTSTTGSALAYWRALGEADERPTWPSTAVVEYAANPKYVQAVSERIDEALQRFPREVRDDVALVFSAHDTSFRDRGDRDDSYCCLVHSTVEQVMDHRDHDRPFHTAFQSMIGPSHWHSPSTPDTLDALAEEGHTAVLMVPITHVTDHVNTSYELDIELREAAEVRGIRHYEVTAGLNTHPLFIEALGEATLSQLTVPAPGNRLHPQGNGHAHTYPLRPLRQLPRHGLNGDAEQCPTCGRTGGARRWVRLEEASEPDVSPERPAARPTDPASSTAGSRSTEES